MHLNGVFLYPSGSIVLTPPVESKIATHFQTVIDKAIVGTETGICLLEVTALDNSVVVEIT